MAVISMDVVQLFCQLNRPLELACMIPSCNSARAVNAEISKRLAP